MGFIADIFTASKAADAQKDASRDSAKASQYATDKTVGLQKEIFDKIWGGTQVQREAGDAATRMMAQLMGLSVSGGAAAQPGGQPQPQVNPGQPGVAPSINGGKNGTGPIFMPGSGVADQTYGGNALGGSLTSGVTGQTQTSGNALGGVTTPAPSTAPAAPFDATAWLRSTPGYEANYNEGARALNHSLASRGSLFSGDAGREAINYGQNYADRIYGDQFNRLAAIAGAGQTATSQGASSGANYANQSGNALQNNAANLSSSYQNRGNAISGFWGNVNGSINNTTNAIGRAMMGGFG